MTPSESPRPEGEPQGSSGAEADSGDPVVDRGEAATPHPTTVGPGVGEPGAATTRDGGSGAAETAVTSGEPGGTGAATAQTPDVEAGESNGLVRDSGGGRVGASPTGSDGHGSRGSTATAPRVLRRLAGRPTVRRRRRMIPDDRPVGTPLTMRPRTVLSWQRTVMSSAMVAVLMMIRMWLSARGYLVLVPFVIFLLPIPWIVLRVRQIRAQPEPDPPGGAPPVVAVAVVLYAVTAIVLMVDQILRHLAG